MDLTLNPTIKKIVRVVVLHLDTLGYGPEGKFSRKAWRDECLKYFNAGKDDFEEWQRGWLAEEEKHDETANFDLELHYEDGSRGYENQMFRARQRSTLDFAGVFFESGFDAVRYKFLHHVYFSYATFYRHAEFFNTEFNKHVEFNCVKFSWGGQFAGARFQEAVLFSRASFEGDTQFVSATFNGNARFDNVYFGGAAQFQYSTFCDKLLFQGAVFDMETWFEKTIFKGAAGFQGVKFNNIAWFKDSIFEHEAWFYKAIFNSQCQFENASFGSEASFENAIFENVGHFEKAHFAGEIPSFLGVENAATRLEFSSDEYFTKDDTTEDAIKRIGQLKRLADEHGQTDQALNFNAMELRAKRLQTEPEAASRSFKVVTWLYEMVSDYGRSFTQPLKIFIYLFLVTFVGALIFAGKSAPIICTERMLQYDGDIQSGSPVSCLSYYQTTDEFKLTGYRAAFEYASYRSSGILDFSDNDKQTSAINMRVFDEKVEPSWVRIWGVFKAIASTALLFLAALGLRNKYRIK